MWVSPELRCFTSPEVAVKVEMSLGVNSEKMNQKSRVRSLGRSGEFHAGFRFRDNTTGSPRL